MVLKVSTWAEQGNDPSLGSSNPISIEGLCSEEKTGSDPRRPPSQPSHPFEVPETGAAAGLLKQHNNSAPNSLAAYSSRSARLQSGADGADGGSISHFVTALPSHLALGRGSHQPRDSPQLRDSQQPPGRGSLTLKEALKKSVSTIRSSYGAAQGFKTLRDHSTIEINAEELKYVKRLGRGAFGEVDCCIFKPQQRVVAVKHLKSNVLLTSNDEVEALKLEICLLRRLQSPFIINFIGFGSYNVNSVLEAERSMFLVEEYADGGTLKAVLSKQMRVDEEIYRIRDAVRWLIGIARGLKYLHESEPMVIHRDLKLENILLHGGKGCTGSDPSTLEPKIADFGLSALVRHNFEAAVEVEELTMSDAEYQYQLVTGGSSQENVDKAVSILDPDKKRESAAVSRRKKDRRTSSVMADEWMLNAKRRLNSLASPDPALPPQPQQPGQQEQEQVITPGEKTLSAKVASQFQLRVAAPGDQLSGRTGTLMYMAPEVYLKLPYNDRADVFSFSIIAYEVLHRYMMICVTNGTLFECQTYARRVARAGFRPPLDPDLPASLRKVIQDCWSPEPRHRPSMAQVVEDLVNVHTTIDWDMVEKQLLLSKEVSPCNCCSIS